MKIPTPTIYMFEDKHREYSQYFQNNFKKKNAHAHAHTQNNSEQSQRLIKIYKLTKRQQI